jgi:hypothetical protein
MDTKSFVKTLRMIIREEVSAAVQSAMKDMLTENTKFAQSSRFDTAARSEARKKQYSKDPMLNDLLNETSGVSADEWPSIDFKSEMANAFGMQRGINGNDHLSMPVTTDITGMPVNMNNEAVAATVNAMTRDYSALMKAIDKKKNR